MSFARSSPPPPPEEYAASSIAGASGSQVTATDVGADSESYMALHEIQHHASYNTNPNNSTRETISLNNTFDELQQQQQQQPDVPTAAAADATEVVHEMHLALLYLLSNPEEFQRALASHETYSARTDGAKTLQEWNAEYHEDHGGDNDSLLTEHTDHHHYHNKDSTTETATENSGTPLPFVVFADDAEVVLPQAHTASQLFGLERVTGIELEAAAGLPALSQLFLRWLAIMPAGDHLNLIDPPGLTVMRIAGGRYRVTAAHRVVWTWMNEFPVPFEQEMTDPSSSAAAHPSTSKQEKNEKKDASSNDKNDKNTKGKESTAQSNGPSGINSSTPPLGGEPIHQLQVGDLVTMTIVDVFETDNQGKLLSYCPTFDNRAIYKTHVTTETLRKSTSQALKLLGRAQKSKLAVMVMRQAKRVAANLRQRVHDAYVSTVHPSNNATGSHEQSSTTSSSQQQQQQQAVAAAASNNNNNAAVDLNLHDDYHDVGDNAHVSYDDTSKALLEFKAAVAAEEGEGKFPRPAASSTYMADDDMERHEV